MSCSPCPSVPDDLCSTHSPNPPLTQTHSHIAPLPHTHSLTSSHTDSHPPLSLTFIYTHSHPLTLTLSHLQVIHSHLAPPIDPHSIYSHLHQPLPPTSTHAYSNPFTPVKPPLLITPTHISYSVHIARTIHSHTLISTHTHHIHVPPKYTHSQSAIPPTSNPPTHAQTNPPAPTCTNPHLPTHIHTHLLTPTHPSTHTHLVHTKSHLP